VVTPQWNKAPQQYNRYNGRPSLSIAGIPNFDTSSGDAMREMENLIAKLPKGIGYEWTGISYRKSNLNRRWLSYLRYLCWSCSCSGCAL
jgi:multidrug efflux pump